MFQGNDVDYQDAVVDDFYDWYAFTWELWEWFPQIQQNRWGWKAKGKAGQEPSPCISSPPSPTFSRFYYILRLNWSSSSRYRSFLLSMLCWSVFDFVFVFVFLCHTDHLHLIILIVVSDMLCNELNSLHRVLHLITLSNICIYMHPPAYLWIKFAILPNNVFQHKIIVFRNTSGLKCCWLIDSDSESASSE